MRYAEVADEFARLAGHAPSRSSFSRWVRAGVRRGDRVVKLAASRVGARWVVPPGAVERFLAELAG